MKSNLADVRYRLRKAIDMKGITQKQLSDKTGISNSSISQYLHGHSRPRPSNVEKLARALDVDPGWLIGFDVTNKPERPVDATDEGKDKGEGVRMKKILVEVVAAAALVGAMFGLFWEYTVACGHPLF